MKIVFVDNSTIVLKTLKTLILELIENKIIFCEFISDERKLYKQLENQTIEYDILFSEIDMQYINGYKLASYAKSIKKYSSKKIVAITTEFSADAQQEGIKNGIDAWFIKSITQDFLQKSILEYIENTKKELSE